MNAAVFRLALGGLSLAGMWAAVTMTGAYYGWWRVPSGLVPPGLCSPRVGGCLDILATPWARVFGPPNSALGIAYYALLIALALVDTGALETAAARISIAVLAWSVVAFSAYLAWSLLFRLKTGCTLCFFSQALNLVLAVVLTFPPPPAAP